MALKSLQNFSVHRPERKPIQFEEPLSKEKKLDFEAKSTQAKNNHTTGLSKTKNFKIGQVLLQSVQNISEHCPERKRIQFEEHLSKQRKFEIEMKPTIPKHHH